MVLRDCIIWLLLTSLTVLAFLFTELHLSRPSVQDKLLSVSGPLHKPFPLLERPFPGSSNGSTQLIRQVSVLKMPSLGPLFLIILCLSVLFICSFVLAFILKLFVWLLVHYLSLQTVGRMRVETVCAYHCITEYLALGTRPCLMGLSKISVYKYIHQKRQSKEDYIYIILYKTTCACLLTYRTSRGNQHPAADWDDLRGVG